MKKSLFIIIPACIVVVLMFILIENFLLYRTYDSRIGKGRVDVYADKIAIINCFIPFGTRYDEHGGKAYFYDINGKYIKTIKLHYLRSLQGVSWDEDGNPTEVTGELELFEP